MKQHLLQDINVYFVWIGHHLLNGTIPRNFPKGALSRNFQPTVYQQIFLIVRNEYIAPEKSGLSAEAANRLASYINLYLLERDLMLDIDSE